ncbi:CynX/NimT family MFS transporter [Sphaerisporangium siamense]|uniref:CP family cyanate transporter-like MFS transporter n=1 Tax=Sphaerisporangium siamense TaxID=795645 RepID=A0A7W7D3U3_9ACTN|nr:MFS transporter [Sphaerisporangium siamense]MBB4699601.1 CP family cyanate transporter-like MFS transporter [Sphaerisporangium siamense]
MNHRHRTHEDARAPATSPPGHARGRRRALGMLAGVVLVALNLRVAVTSLGAVLDQARADLAMSAVAASTAAALPVVCFGGVALAVPWLIRRVGAMAGLGVTVGLLLAGLLIRVAGGEITLLTGTFVACAGIAGANVLIPVIVKMEFPARVGEVTGAYSAAMSAGAAIGAAATVPAGDVLGGWRGGLAVWSVLAAAALAVWLPLTRRGAAPAEPRARTSALTRSPVAWTVTLLFATQSLLAFVVMAWLPTIYLDIGYTPGEAGTLLAVALVVGVPVYFAVPILAARMRRQGAFGVGMTAVHVAGLLGLLLRPESVPWLWALFIGVGGGVFPLTLALFSMRTRTAEDTAALSAMAQSVGYLLAAFGPFTVGLLREATGSWSVPVALLVAICVVQAALCLGAGRPRFVERGARAAVPVSDGRRRGV